MYVQGTADVRNERFRLEVHRERYNFPLHLHYFIEFIYMIKGIMDITVNGRKERLEGGQGAIILPYLEHSFHSEGENEFAIITFSPNIVSRFIQHNEGLVGERTVFELSDLCKNVIDERLIRNQNASIYNIKGCLYMMLDDYVGQVKMVKGVAGRKCFDKVIYYLQANCNKSCKLTDVARALGYTPQHISSCISNNMKVSYCSLLNGMRIDKSKNLLVDTELSVLEVSYECGFNDLRSFQRNFKKAVGITPTEYRTVNKMEKKDIINSYRSPSIFMTSWEVY